MLRWLRHWRVRRFLKRNPIDHALWHSLMTQPIFAGLTSVQKAHLRELTILFRQHKHFRAADGLHLDEARVLALSAYACLLVLELGLDYYDGWQDIIVYPSAFWVERDEVDDNGVVVHQHAALGGEAWLGGAVVLNWQDFQAEAEQIIPGRNLVVHEFAHKLDMLNGRANGMPPLHQSMQTQRWTQAFSQAFEQLQNQVAHGQHTQINPYAASDPAEFFAVSSEYFFTAPRLLHHTFPEVYRQLSLFYRQHPLSRMG
jgi:hypothetical protein